MDPAYAVRVTDAFGASSEPATRVHDGVRLLTGHTVHPPSPGEPGQGIPGAAVRIVGGDVGHDHGEGQPDGS
jgi:hypothetical protein